MKKQYNSMKVEVSLFDIADVLTTSSGNEALGQDNTKSYSEWNTSSVWND